MTRFTANNTDGYSARDLETVNAALDRLLELGGDDSMDALSDAVHNAWVPGATVDELVSRCARLLGL